MFHRRIFSGGPAVPPRRHVLLPAEHEEQQGPSDSHNEFAKV